MDKSVNVMNLIAYPCVIKNDQGNPTYGLLIRPSSSMANDKTDNEDCNILDIQQQNISSPSYPLRNQVFIPASAVPNFQQKFCNGQEPNKQFQNSSDYSTLHLQQSFSGENSNLYSGNELQHILDEIDTSDISSFLQELSYDSQELIHLDGSASINSSQLEIMDPMPSNMLADRLVLHHEQQQQQQPCCSKYVEPLDQMSCRYQVNNKHPPPNDPPPVPHAPDPHIAVYHDVGTPDSGIQSIGESPRALMQNSPAQPLPSSIYNSNNNNSFFIQSPPPPAPIPSSSAHHRSSLMEPLMINIDSKFAAPNADFEDMPRLEPENEKSCKNLDEIPNEELESTNKLLDRILSSLPAEQLANVSKLLDKKLKACSKSEETLISVDLDKINNIKPTETHAAVKKLADYRQKMKQKRESEKLFREIENLCDRLNNITSDQSRIMSDMKNSASYTLKFLHNIQWSKKCFQGPPVECEKSTVDNLEIESNDNEDEMNYKLQTTETPSLKVKIRILRRESSHLQRYDSGSSTQDSTLPLKKRFKGGPNFHQQVPQMDQLCHKSSPALGESVSNSDSRSTRSSKRKQVVITRDSSPKLRRHQIDTCLLKKNRSVVVNKLSLGLLKKCQACSMWSKVPPNFKEKKLKACRNCQDEKNQNSNKISSQDSLLTTIRLLPPKKKFIKCGNMSIDVDRLTLNSTSPFSPKHCFVKNLGSGSHFDLPYDLWWQFVYQKNFTCRNPSTNYKRIRNNIYVDSANKMTSAPGCQPCACKSAPGFSTCGENCLNRVMFTECTPGVCPCGENCSNRRFQKRQWASALDKFWTGTSKGFGVRTNEVIKNGSFICEYLGEVVNWETFAERTRTWYRNCDRHYALNLDSGWVIDGYRSGSVARFINHSCEPNCEVQKWVVNGQYRMGIFAVIDIEAGQELTYNYNFQSFSRTGPEKCLCRSEKCSGAVGLSWSNKRCRASFLLRNYRKILRRKSRNMGGKKVPFKMDFLRHFLLEKCRLSAKFRNFNDETILKGFWLNFRGNFTQFTPNFVDILRKILFNRPADNLMQELTKYLLDLYSKNEQCLEKVYDDGDSRPLVGEYDPDRVNLDLDLWSKNRTPDTDKVRCLCGSFEDDGEMVQCDVCFYWLHADCLNLKPSTSSGENFACKFCRAIDCSKNQSRDAIEKCIRKQFCDIILEPQPDFKLQKCTYYKALMCGDLQIRLGDCVYLRRDVSEIQKRLLNDLNEECVVKHSKNIRQIQSQEKCDRQANCFNNELSIKKNQTFHRKDLRIMRVERLFIGPRDVRFMFGSYFAHHYETFCEPSRRFYKNEVFVTPLYDTWPLETSVVGRCLVSDPTTFCRGRPCFPAYDERDVFVCEYRVDKSQRLFDKSSSTKCGGRLQINCQSFIFRNFQNKLKIWRNFTPFNDQLKNKSKTKVAATEIALSNEQIDKLSKFSKRIRLDQQIARIKNL